MVNGGFHSYGIVMEVIDVPDSQWLVDENRGFFHKPQPSQQLNDAADGIPAIPAPTYFYQKDMFDGSGRSDTIIRYWLVVWLPFFIFPYIGNTHPK